MSLTVEVQHVTQKFGDVAALDDVSFTLSPNVIYGLIGRNGSGKSTLLSLLAAFRKPTAGEIRLDGEPLFENPRLTRQVALIRESVDTVESSEKIPAALDFAASLRPNWDNAFANELIDSFGLDRSKKIRELSRGQRSALGITLGLASRAPITMFDEAHLGLDAPSRLHFYDQVLADYMRHPRTFIISSHLIEEVSPLFQEVLVLHRGKLLLHQETTTLLDRGATITGPAEAVERFTAGRRVLNERRLGPTLAVTIFDILTESDRRSARDLGLDVGPVGLQELFVHLTGEEA